MTFEILGLHHCQNLLAFELENRSYFETMISGRPESFYSTNGIHAHVSELTNKAHSQSCIALLAVEAGEILARANIHSMDLSSASCEIGYRVAQKRTGKGIATACIQHLTHTAIETLHMRSVVARVLDNNPASKKALLKCGFISEGKSDEILFIANKRHHCFQYRYVPN